MARCYRWIAWLVVAVTTVVACSPGRQGTASEAVPGQPAALNRTLVIGIAAEPTTLAGRPPTTSGQTPGLPTMVFDAWLMVSDGRNNPRPQLIEKLPELNTDDWKVFPDGKMETNYRLKPGIRWHDGTPLTAHDFVFGWRVWTWPDMGVPTDAPIRYMQEVSAADDRTVVVRWSQLFPDAAALSTTRYGALPPMPRHLIEPKFQAGDVQGFLNDPWWTQSFVGAGPYRLDRWEPGAFISATAFPGWIEGPAKIPQLRIVFMGDPNTAVAGLQSGDAHLIGEESIGFEQGNLLRKEWEASGQGVVMLTPNKTRFIQIQFKNGYTNPQAILDRRVRQAFLESIDRQALSEGILDGQNAIAHTLAGPVEEYFAELDRTGTKYPYSVQDATALMTQAGFTKGSDGIFADLAGQKLSLELRAFPSEPSPREAAILADTWKRFGADINIYIIPSSLVQNLEQVSAYPAFRIEQTGFTGTSHLTKLCGCAVATESNRWGGVNRGGWVNPEYDRLIDLYSNSLDRAERNRGALDGLKIVSNELPVLALYYLSLASAYTSALTGPNPGYASDTAWDNISQWEWVR